MANTPQENTQGAPTEGLGQTVTFVGGDSTPQARLQVPGATLGGSGLNVSGNGTHATQVAGVHALPPDPTLSLLSRVMDDVAKKKMEERRTEAYFDGMQQAASGKAVQDIVNDQPWYSKVFGDTDVVEGARAYGANAHVARTMTAMEVDMPNLAKMDGQAFSGYYNKMVQDSLTGDKPTDAVIMQSLTRHMPQAMTRQAKEHYAWTQTNLISKMNENFVSSAGQLQAMAPAVNSETRTPEDFEAAKRQFVLDQIPPQGIDDEHFKNGTTQMLILAAKDGNIHAIDAYQKSGILNQLKPEQQGAIQSAREAAEQKMRVRYSYKWNDRLIETEIMAKDLKEGESVRDVLTKVDTINQQYQQETGASTGLISPGERSALAQHGYAGILRERQRIASDLAAATKAATTDEQKQLAKDAKNAEIDKHLAAGTAGILVALPGYGKEEIDARAGAMWNGTEQPADKLKLMGTWWQTQYVPTTIAKQMDSAAGNAIIASKRAFSGAIQGEYAKWQGLNAYDPNMASSYYKENGPLFKRYDENLKSMGSDHAEQAWSAAVQPTHAGGVSKDDRKAAISATAGGVFGFTPTQASLEHVLPSLQVRADAAARDGFQDDKVGAAKHALAGLKADGKLDQVGNYMMAKDPTQRTFAEYLNTTGVSGKAMPVPVDTHAFQSHMNMFTMTELQAVAGNRGVKPESVYIWRMPDQTFGDGKQPLPVFKIMAQDSDNNPLPAVLSTAEHIRQHMLNMNAGYSQPVEASNPASVSKAMSPEEYARQRRAGMR